MENNTTLLTRSEVFRLRFIQKDWKIVKFEPKINTLFETPEYGLVDILYVEGGGGIKLVFETEEARTKFILLNS